MLLRWIDLLSRYMPRACYLKQSLSLLTLQAFVEFVAGRIAADSPALQQRLEAFGRHERRLRVEEVFKA